MQKLGQHFLKNKSIISKIIDTLALQPGDIVFEIGPGRGELTKELEVESEKRHSYVVPAQAGIHALKKQKNGLKIISVEKDEDLCESLKKQFENDPHIEIVCGDALKLLPPLISKLCDVKNLKYKLVGNIPYYITGHLLRIVSELKNKPGRSVFMVQKEVAERIVAQPPKMNRLAASVQFWAETKIIANVPKHDFSPAPKVDSAVVLLEQKTGSAPIGANDYYAAVRILFGQPRKTILNNVLQKCDVGRRTFISAALKKIGIDRNPALKIYPLKT